MTLPMVRPRPRGAGGGSGVIAASANPSEAAMRYIPYIAVAVVLALIGSATIFNGYPLTDLATRSTRTASGRSSSSLGRGVGGQAGGLGGTRLSSRERDSGNNNNNGDQESPPRSLTAVVGSAASYRAGGDIVDLSGSGANVLEESERGAGGPGPGTILSVFQPRRDDVGGSAAAQERDEADPVSYTHLTLPTICSV